MIPDLNKLRAVKNAKGNREREVHFGMCVLQIKFFAVSYIFIYFDHENYSCLMFEYPTNAGFTP